MTTLYYEVVRWHDRCEELLDSLPETEQGFPGWTALVLLKAELHERYEELDREMRTEYVREAGDFGRALREISSGEQES